MKLVDANLLLFAYNPSAPEHSRAAKWLEDAFWSDEPVTTSWTTLLAFLRLSTSPKIFARPYSPKESTQIVDGWLADAGLSIAEPTENHWSVFRSLIDETGARGNLVSDVHLAALAIEHGATVCTDDVDFRRFKRLKLEFPLR